MSKEAVEWLEARPLDFWSGIRYYADAGSAIGVTHIINVDMFSLKDDHEAATYNACAMCNSAQRQGQLLVVDES